MNSRIEGRAHPEHAAARFPRRASSTRRSFARSSGRARPFPGAKIDEHSVIVPDFGTIFFGELLISAFERRLTMVRFELGSPLRGYVGGRRCGEQRIVVSVDPRYFCLIAWVSAAAVCGCTAPESRSETGPASLDQLYTSAIEELRKGELDRALQLSDRRNRGDARSCRFRACPQVHAAPG